MANKGQIKYNVLSALSLYLIIFIYANVASTALKLSKSLHSII